MRYYRNYGAKNINLAPIDDLVKILPTQEQTGKIVTFDSPFAGLPLKSCKVNIPVTQEGTGDPSPTNVRNFVGVSSLDFTANSVVKTFQFGQTVYAGELDVLRGIGKFTGIIKINEIEWVYQTDKNRFYGIMPSRPVKPSVNEEIPKYFACECYRVHSYTGYQDGDISITTMESIFVKDSNFTDVDTWLNAVGDYRINYELAEPEVINLGGMNIETLQGENNLFASTGETTAQYFKK